MITRLLAGLIVAFGASDYVSAAEGQVGAGAATFVVAAESSTEKTLEWDDADPTPDKSEQSAEDRGAAKPDDAKPAAAKSEKASEPSPTPSESAKTTEPSKPAQPVNEPKSAEGATPSSKPDAPKQADPLAKPRDAVSAAKENDDAKAVDAARAKPGDRAADAVTRPTAGRPAKGSLSVRTEQPVEPAVRPRPARGGRDGASSDFATTRTTDRGRGERVWVSPDDEPVATRRETYGASRRPAMRTAQAVRRPSALATAPMAEEVAARQSTPISGGILCGGGSKWRCNWIEREHDKFYKFTKGHGWTDQTMATDFCATERQMRVASANRIKSIQGGCCGFVIVQVTCKR